MLTRPTQLRSKHKKIYGGKKTTCIQVSSICRSGEFSGDETGGIGWISFGTTTRSLPSTKMAPALLAVPAAVEEESSYIDENVENNPLSIQNQ